MPLVRLGTPVVRRNSISMENQEVVGWLAQTLRPRMDHVFTR